MVHIQREVTLSLPFSAALPDGGQGKAAWSKGENRKSQKLFPFLKVAEKHGGVLVHLKSYKDHIPVIRLNLSTVRTFLSQNCQLSVTVWAPGPRDYKTFFTLNSVEHEILNAHKYKNIKKYGFF